MELIKQTILQDKEESWKIPQNFSLGHVKTIIEKTRILVTATIKAEKSIQEPAKDSLQISEPINSNTYLVSNTDEIQNESPPKSTNEFMESGNRFELPKINSKGRLYDPR